MENFFKIEIVSPEKKIFFDENVTEVVIPSYEGEMGIMKDHISLISFLKPGIIQVLKNSEKKGQFFKISFTNVSFVVLLKPCLSSIENVE